MRITVNTMVAGHVLKVGFNIDLIRLDAVEYNG